MPANVPGIHHVTCITGDVQRNVDFYVSVLGLRFIKKSINQDVPDTYHLYFGDYLGTPGTAMTFFGWPSWPKRRTGSGQVTTVAFAVPHGSLEFWRGRLRRLGVDAGRRSRFDSDVLVLEDPDGLQLELVAEGSEPVARGAQPDLRWAPWKEGPVEVEHAIRGFHSVTLTVAEAGATADLLTRTMGFRRAGQDGGRTRFETAAGGPAATLDLVESPEGPVGAESLGTVHHVAWRAAEDAQQSAWRAALIEAGLNVTPVIDRYYFRSIYYREPGGSLFEIATDGPGFTVDEAPEALGSTLSLPPWFQVRRDTLDHTLTPIVVPTTATTGAGH
ncbi:ring-cleaving dioxygenase [bacterium]|nr:MAG: ring-cleaving dioxygenase [bacterium]